MCGFTGFLGPCASPAESAALVDAMSDTLHHRGPDDGGNWVDAAAGVALGHRRLAIVDLSPLGHQPMGSASGRYQIAFNGEIYNFRTLRTELEGLGHPFKGHSDTEVMLAAFEAWGVDAAVARFTGMFAFALWDRETRHLHLGRDRMGEKPLYYGWCGEHFLFGSELKALKKHPSFDRPVDRGALALLLRHNYVPTPYSIYNGISKLLPGSILTVDPTKPGRLPEPKPYWSATQVAEAGISQPFEGSDDAAVDHLDSLLKASVADQMLADVPLGVFLSGGIDSSTVTALMQALSDRPVKSFTIGFNEKGFDEAPHGREVAKHLGTEHTELYVTPEQALEVIPKLPTLYDEPFSDVSQVPTFLLSQMARKHVTVALSGDGGDELFWGYTRYQIALDTYQRMGRIPGPLRKTMAAAMTALSPDAWNRLFGWAGPILARYGKASVGDKLHAAGGMMAAGKLDAIYRRMVSHWDDPASAVIGATEPSTILNQPDNHPVGMPSQQRLPYWDLFTYLPDDILVKVDRAAMGVSLETREPLLDHRVVEFSASLPQHFKVRDGKEKWLLRQVLYRYVPKAMVERPKMGFGVPIGEWLKGPLKDWAEHLLAEERLKNDGFFDVTQVRTKWAQHLNGSRNWQYHLWDVLMFQAWLAEQNNG
jgi:asparagine synthase (glutamine-hydrolysing)